MMVYNYIKYGVLIMKILASDFDKTLYIEDSLQLNKNISSILDFMRLGNIFIIITGRSYFDIKLLLNQYHIPYTYLICEDGAKIYDSNDYCLSTSPIEADIVKKIISIVEEFDYTYLLDDGYNYTTNINDCVKVVIPYHDSMKASLLLLKIKESVSIEGYISREHININGKGVNKFNSLKRLISMENFNYDDLYVIGDEINDLEMIQNFNGAIMEDHNKVFDNINKKSYKYLYMYIEELCKK